MPVPAGGRAIAAGDDETERVDPRRRRPEARRGERQPRRIDRRRRLRCSCRSGSILRTAADGAPLVRVPPTMYCVPVESITVIPPATSANGPRRDGDRALPAVREVEVRPPRLVDDPGHRADQGDRLWNPRDRWRAAERPEGPEVEELRRLRQRRVAPASDEQKLTLKDRERRRPARVRQRSRQPRELARALHEDGDRHVRERAVLHGQGRAEDPPRPGRVEARDVDAIRGRRSCRAGRDRSSSPAAPPSRGSCSRPPTTAAIWSLVGAGRLGEGPGLLVGDDLDRALRRRTCNRAPRRESAPRRSGSRGSVYHGDTHRQRWERDGRGSRSQIYRSRRFIDPMKSLFPMSTPL